MSVMRSSIFVFVFVLLHLNACTAIHFNTLPPPPPTNKLRVFIMPVTGTAPHAGMRFGWARSHEQFKRDQLRAIGNYLNDTGIYEVVSDEEIRASLGTQDFAVWQWLGNDMALAKEAGKALHADYAIISIRNAVSSGDFESKIVCVNIESGRQYTNSFYVSLSSAKSREGILSLSRKMFHVAYRKMFHEVKEDLLATAVRKGQQLPKEESRKPKPPGEIKKPVLPEVKVALVPPPPPQPATPPPPVAVEQKPAPVVEAPDKPQVLAISKPPEPDAPPDMPDADNRVDLLKLGEEFQEAVPTPGKARLVVYDFEAAERLNVVALILTEALREELFILGRFTLVNRENMIQVLEELKLQQSGLVDESQVVKLGKWLAANEAVSGRLAILGNAYILQAKRVDISTMGTLGRGSLKCTAGHEEELLSGMPVLAKKLIDSMK